MESGREREPLSMLRLARGSLLVTVSNVVPRAGALLLLPLYTRFLDAADFGVVSLASSGALLLATTARLGLDASLLRMHHDADGAGRRSLYASMAVATLISAAVLSLAAGAVVIAVADGTGTMLVQVTMLALAIGVANTFQFIPSVWFRGRDRTGRYLLLALAAFGATVVVSILAVVVLRMGAIGALAGQLAGAVLTAGVAAVIVWRLRPWRPRAETVRRALRFGLPLLPHSAAGWLLNVSDRWLLAVLLGLTATETLTAIGVYSLGYQLGYAVGIAAISFNAAWLPFLYRLDGAPAAREVLRHGTTVVVGGFVALAAVVAIAAPDIVAVIAPREWAAAADVTAVVAFASAFNAAGLMFASGVLLARHTGAIALISLAAAAVNLALNLVLIPLVGIVGAAWATLVAYLVLAALTGVAAWRRHPAAIDLPALGVMLVIAAALTVASRQSPAGSWHLVVGLGVVIAIGFAARGPLRAFRAAVSASGRGVPEVR